MSLSEIEKFDFTLAFVLENEGLDYVENDFRGGISRYGLNTTVFPFLEYNVDFQSLTVDKAEDIHEKILWNKYDFTDIVNVEVISKIYDFMLMFGEEDILLLNNEVLQSMGYNNLKQTTLNINVLNQVERSDRSDQYIQNLIQLVLGYANNIESVQKRIERLPTI